MLTAHLYGCAFTYKVFYNFGKEIKRWALFMKRTIRKLLYGLIPVLCMVLSSCTLGGIKSGKKRRSSSSSTSSPSYVPPDGDPDNPDVAPNYITGIGMKYTKDFYMQVGDELDFSVSFKGGGDESQKGIRWTTSNPKVISVTTKEKTSQCVLSALREGTINLIATSTYNPSLTAQVGITVIDNSGYTYIYQKNKNVKDDKAFNDDEGKTKTDGTITLAGQEWTFHFDTPDVAVGGGQSLKFGSGKVGYGNIDFTLPNTRKIRKVSVLCSSAAKHIDDGSSYGTSEDHGSSKISINIGDTEYVAPTFTPKNSNDTDLELDTISGVTDNSGVLTGDIHIHFSPTYNDESGVNKGAIYLRSIIIEYYRGDLTRIEVDHPSNYFVGTKIREEDNIVTAYFSESTEIGVVVTRFAKFETTGLDKDGYFTTANASQAINVSYSFDKGGVTQTKSLSYTVHVYDRLKQIAFEGSLTKNTYLVNEAMDYSGININLYVDDGTNNPAFTYSLNDYKEDSFLDMFDISQVHSYAIAKMSAGFTISLKHKLTGLNGSHNFASGDIVVKEVKGIEISYKDGAEYTASYKEGEEYSYDDFKATITYSNDDTDTFAFADLKKQTYNIDGKNNVARYNYTNYSPLVAAKKHGTEGFTVKVVSTINNVAGTFDVSAEQIDIVEISALKLNFTEFDDPDYEEFDKMDYSGVTLDITYSDGSSSKGVEYDVAASMMTKIAEISSGNWKVVEKPLFSVDAPEVATREMASDGFTIKFTSYFNSAVTASLNIPANSINVDYYHPKTYTRVTNSENLVSGGKYIIVSILDTNLSQMMVWNGALSKDEVVKSNNTISYTHSSIIGNTAEFNDKSIENAYFTINEVGTEDSEKTYEIVHQNGAKLSMTGSGGCSFSTKSVEPLKIRYTSKNNAKIIGNPENSTTHIRIQMQVFYSPQYKTIKAYNIPSGGNVDPEENTDTTHRPVQIYRVGS